MPKITNSKKRRKIMSSNINKVILTGNLTRDAELRFSQSGTAIASFSIAVNDSVKDASTGEWGTYANFFDCTLFGKRAEGLNPYLKKGQKVAIDGKLRFSSWESEGQKRSKVGVIVDNLELCGGKRNDSQAVTNIPQGNEFDNSIADEDIPF